MGPSPRLPPALLLPTHRGRRVGRSPADGDRQPPGEAEVTAGSVTATHSRRAARTRWRRPVSASPGAPESPSRASGHSTHVAPANSVLADPSTAAEANRPRGRQRRERAARVQSARTYRVSQPSSAVRATLPSPATGADVDAVPARVEAAPVTDHDADGPSLVEAAPVSDHDAAAPARVEAAPVSGHDAAASSRVEAAPVTDHDAAAPSRVGAAPVADRDDAAVPDTTPSAPSGAPAIDTSPAALTGAAATAAPDHAQTRAEASPAVRAADATAVSHGVRSPRLTSPAVASARAAASIYAHLAVDLRAALNDGATPRPTVLLRPGVAAAAAAAARLYNVRLRRVCVVRASACSRRGSGLCCDLKAMLPSPLHFAIDGY